MRSYYYDTKIDSKFDSRAKISRNGCVVNVHAVFRQKKTLICQIWIHLFRKLKMVKMKLIVQCDQHNKISHLDCIPETFAQ